MTSPPEPVSPNPDPRPESDGRAVGLSAVILVVLSAAVIFWAGLSLGVRVDDDGFGVADQKVLEGDHLVSPETEGRIVDPNLVVLQFTERGQSRAPIATIVNFGSHPEALWSSNTVLTSDFPHYVRERLEQEYGGTAIWTSGALGVLQGPDRIDVSEDGINPVVKRSFEFARVHGGQLAERAIEALDSKPGHPARLGAPLSVGHPAAHRQGTPAVYRGRRGPDPPGGQPAGPGCSRQPGRRAATT